MELETHLLRLAETIDRLTEAQIRTEAAVTRLAEVQARTEEQLVRQGAQIEALAEAQRQTTTQIEALLLWQRGEAGRRDGERYERNIVRRAPVLFNGGRGGSLEQPEVQRHLTELLRTVLAKDILATEADPFLADLVWWKGDQLAIVEAAVQVNGEDVHRVAQRVATLRQAGVQAIAVVIGEHWATLDTRERARLLNIDWKVGSDLSEGFLAVAVARTVLTGQHETSTGEIKEDGHACARATARIG